MMIALPNKDGSFTVTLFWPFEGRNSFAELKSDADILSFFKETFPDAVTHMPTLVEDFKKNPVSSLVTVRCRPWHFKDRAVLLGDAAHAVVPFYGQGMNASFEDCTVLAECFRRNPSDTAKALSEYSRERKENVDALADEALHNFIEMRDHTGRALFRLKKTAERFFARLLPFWYIPLYSMIQFTRIPYAEAVRKAERQKRIMAACVFFLLAAGIAGAYAYLKSCGSCCAIR